VADLRDARLDVADAQQRRLVHLQKAVFTIGRRSDCDLHLTGPHVSRDHAEISLRGNQFVVRDRGSRYGTFVNAEPVVERELRNGDRIRLGDLDEPELVFLVREDVAAEPSQAAGASAESLRQIAALLHGLQALTAGHVLNDVLDLVLDAAIDVTGAERGFIMLANAAGVLEFTRARVRGRVAMAGKTFETSLQIPERVFVTGRTEIVSDLRDEGGEGSHAGTIALGIRHVLCAPLRLVQYVDASGAAPEQKRIGVLYLDSREKGTLLSATTRAGVETLAREAAVAIENARLYRETLEKARLDQELVIAAEIQRGLMPVAKYVGAGFEIAGSSLPCRAIGGDFFDHLELPSGDFGFALGDVAGKGPPAALLTVALQALFTAHAAAEGGPAATQARLNTALIRRAVDNRFATMVYGVLSPGGLLTYSSAGHNPPILFTRNTIRRLEQGGLVLGMFPGARYEEEAIQLDPGDVLVFFSDGISEAVDVAGDDFGDDRIISCLQPCLHLDPQMLLDRLLAAVREFSEGTVQHDDMTALVLRYTGI
jgi:sigma-B regulation protein RsbU (phosphoserine phosphatase)